MPRRRIAFDIAVNTPSAQREADRLKNIFQSRLGNIQVGTQARGGMGGAAGGGGGGGGAQSKSGSSSWGMPGSGLKNLAFGSAQFALAGYVYQFYSQLPQMIAEMDRMAVATKRTEASFRALAGGGQEATEMVNAFIEGSGGAVSRLEATEGAMRLFNIGMAEGAEEMRAFTTLSRGMAQALGRDVDYIQEQFSLALANQSELRFDQLGISIERHKELMEDLKEQYPEMSTELVFQNAMLQQATERYYNLATAQEALAVNTELATASLKDQGAELGKQISERFWQPTAGMLAGALGSEALNLRAPEMREWARERRETAESRGMQPNIGALAVGGLVQGLDNDQIGLQWRALNEQLNGVADVGERAAEVMDQMQASMNLGIKPSQRWIDIVGEAADAVANGTASAEEWIPRLNAISLLLQAEVTPASDNAADSLFRLTDAAEVLAQQAGEVADRLLGAAQGMVGKLIREGMSPEQAAGMVGTEQEIRDMATAIVEEGRLRGDVISDEMALVAAEQQILAKGDQWIEAAAESERASKAAASELEQAAKAAEKAFVNAADTIMDQYSEMLHQIPGLFGTSEVTEEDLELAKMGYPTNFVDDALRRLEDVVFNKVERPDVDFAAWAKALRLPEDTDPKALAIYARRAWESGELWANPENIEQFMNIDAAKGELRGQELSALGQQNLEAFFGIGTEEGNEFLRVFGMQALDPIQDGLITEITTRGPIMGSTLADAMYTGFSNRALELPWVQSLMSAIDSAVGRQILEGLNTGSTSDQAASESAALEE